MPVARSLALSHVTSNFARVCVWVCRVLMRYILRLQSSFRQLSMARAASTREYSWKEGTASAKLPLTGRCTLRNYTTLLLRGVSSWLHHRVYFVEVTTQGFHSSDSSAQFCLNYWWRQHWAAEILYLLSSHINWLSHHIHVPAKNHNAYILMISAVWEAVAMD